MVIRIGITNSPPLLFSSLRFSLAALPLVFFIGKPNVSWRIIFGIGFVLGVIKFSLLFVGMDLGLSAGFMWAISNLLMKQAGQVDMLALMVWVGLVPPIPLFLLSMLIEGPDAAYAAVTQITWSGIGAVAYIAFVATILGFAIWGKLIRIYGAGRVAPFSLLVPIFGMGSSALLLGEEFGPVRLIGAAMIICGLILTVMVKSKK